MVRRPTAEVIPGYGGTMTSGIPIRAATSTACSGPAPPNATREKSRGSTPFWTVRELMALAMFALTIATTPSAASRSSTSSRSARRPMAAAAAASSSAIAPPRK